MPLDVSPVPRVALKVSAAAAALDVSEDFFASHIAPELRIVRRGRKKLVAVSELQRWIDENSERVMDGVR